VLIRHAVAARPELGGQDPFSQHVTPSQTLFRFLRPPEAVERTEDTKDVKPAEYLSRFSKRQLWFKRLTEGAKLWVTIRGDADGEDTNRPKIHEKGI
jgi:hypothetical protein